MSSILKYIYIYLFICIVFHQVNATNLVLAGNRISVTSCGLNQRHAQQADYSKVTAVMQRCSRRVNIKNNVIMRELSVCCLHCGCSSFLNQSM